jgi:putative transposase
MLKAYKYYLLPSPFQKEQLSKFFGCTRFVYNKALLEEIKHYSEYLRIQKFKQYIEEHPEELENYQENTEKIKPYLSYNKISASYLVSLKSEFPFLKYCHSQVLQQSLKHLDSAYQSFFKKSEGFPKFKHRYGDQSISFPQGILVDFKKDKVKIPKLGEMFCRLHRQFKGEIKTCTISKSFAGQYYISILVENNKPIPEKAPVPDTIFEGNIVGIDLGIKSYATFSDGTKLENPKYYEKELKKIARLNQILSRQEKGSNNYKKTQYKLAKLAERVRNKRKDFQHKLSRNIVNENQVIIVEKLAVQEMLQKSSNILARYIQDAGWSQFIEMLKYKSEWYGKRFVQIGRYEPTSKKCHCCGKINKNLVLSDREWECSNCGIEHDRDINAAINILNLGYSEAQGLGKERAQEKEVENLDFIEVRFDTNNPSEYGSLCL